VPIANPALTEIALMAAGLEIGSSIRIECPFCRNHERTMSVSRTATGILYNCFRASCTGQGHHGTAASLQPAEIREAKLRPYLGETFPLEVEDYRFFREKYELPTEAVSTRIMLDGGGHYVLPIFNPHGYVKGFNVRMPWPGAPRQPTGPGPKANVYMHSHGPVQSFYGSVIPRLSPRPIVLVEDQLSAIKAAQTGAVAYAVALLGAGGSTRLGSMSGSDGIRELSAIKPREVIVAFDADATDSAFKWARKWGLAFPKVRVAVLERDLKDTQLNDIADALNIVEV
jgi:hypothetical protein